MVKKNKDGSIRQKPGPKPKSEQPPQKNRSPIQRHFDNCAVCQHAQREEMEELYALGESPYEIADKFKLEYWTIRRHAKAYKLDDKRDHSTLTKVRRIIDRAKLGTRKPSDALVSKALELEGKVTGEMVERQKVEHTGKVDVSVAAQRQVDNLKKKIGLTIIVVEEETDGDGT